MRASRPRARRGAIAAFAVAAIPLSAAAQPRGPAPAPAYGGYAYPECGAANAPAIHVVLLMGGVPDAVPARPPRPSIELLFNARMHRFTAQPATFRVDSPRGPVAMTCPVVGSCAVAQSGEVSIQRRESDGALAGEFRITWPDDPARATVVVRRFVAAWRDVPSKCH